MYGVVTYISYLHEQLIFIVNVGKYTSPMDGNGYQVFHLGIWNRKRCKEEIKTKNDLDV